VPQGIARVKLPALVHSPSSVALAERCHRAWWLRYREGIKQPEFLWSQVVAYDAWASLPFAKRLRTPMPTEPKGGQRSTALGKEVHRRAEIYLTRGRDRERKRLDWTDLPGLCLAELVRHLPPAGSLSRSEVERNVTLKFDGVSFRGVVDIATAAQRVLESYDHKTSGDIMKYGLLAPPVAERLRKAWLRAVPKRAQRLLKAPSRSLRDDLQACFYTLARLDGRGTTWPQTPGGIVRWNYTETKRIRRSLPVVAYVPTEHARTVVQRAADTARTVAALATIDDAIPNTLACDDYGGCWYRLEGHCKAKRAMGAVILRAEALELEHNAMKQDKSTPKRFKDLTEDTEAANEAEERAARKAAKAAKLRAAEEESDEDESEEEEAPESEPAPKPKASKRKPAPEPEEDEDAEEEDEDDAPESEPAPAPKAKSPRAAAQAAFDDVVPHDAVLAHFDRVPADASPRLQEYRDAFRKLAQGLATVLKPANLDRAVALRRLLEARSAAFDALHTEGVAELVIAPKRSKAGK
jgi:outer membrane biosynthesis protein TonB